MQPNRPSDGELDRKLKAAKAALRTQTGLYANFNKVVGELYELDMESQNQVWQLIVELLEEILPKDYAGTRPPQKSYEKTVAGVELFAFCWDSKKLGQKMYIKFALKDNRYYYLSLHKSKELS
jgi:hypothetical protein